MPHKINPQRSDEFPALSGLCIYGVEVTQATQYWHAFDPSTAPKDTGPDNSIPLVADKRACLLVYVGRLVGEQLPVSGTVTLQRPHRGIWIDADTLMPMFGAIIAQSKPTYSLLGNEPLWEWLMD